MLCYVSLYFLSPATLSNVAGIQNGMESFKFEGMVVIGAFLCPFTLDGSDAVS